MVGSESNSSMSTRNTWKEPVRQNVSYSKRISWSKNGFIAYSSPSNKGSNLVLSCLESVDGKVWQISKPQELQITLENNFTPELTMVSWSNLSTDLAVADVYGNFYILLAGVGLVDHSGETKSPGNDKVAHNGSQNGNGNHNGTSVDKKGTSPSSGSPSYELTSYNHMEIIYRDIHNPQPKLREDSTARIIAFEWFYTEKPQIINKAAVLNHPEPSQTQSKSSFAYSYGVDQYLPNTITHPISTKQACLVLRQNGELVLYYQGEHKVEYHKISVKLTDDDILITKGSIGFTDSKKIIVTFYDAVSKLIITYSIVLDWGHLTDAAKRQKTDPHYQTPKDSRTPPTLNLTKLHEMVPSPTYIDNSVSDDDKMDVEETDKQNDEKETGELHSIEIISPFYEKGSELNILISYNFDLSNFSHTRTDRYVLRSQADLVSDTFKELGIRKNKSQTESNSQLTVSYFDSLERPSKLQLLQTSLMNSIIVFVFQDGRVDVFDRRSMKLINDPDRECEELPNEIRTIFDVGFDFPRLDSKGSLMLALSPSLTSIIYRDIFEEEEKLNIQVVRKVKNVSINPRSLFVTSSALAFCHSYACYSNSSAEDLIVVIVNEIKRIRDSISSTNEEKVGLIVNKFIESTICESHKAINFQLDSIGKESIDKLLSNPPLQKLLSLQLALGESQEKRALYTDIAWIILNLRVSSFGIMFSLSNIYRQIAKKKPSEDTLNDSILRAECIMSLLGNVKWIIDLMSYINQELLQLWYAKSDPQKSILNFSNSVALPLILSKVSRLFLMYALSSIGKTHEILRKLHKDLSESNKIYTPMKQALDRYFTLCNSSPLALNIFEVFLREFDTFIGKDLTTRFANKGKGYALKSEQKLVCQATLNEDMQQIAHIVIDRHSVSIGRDSKVSKLYFYDVDWLEIGIHRDTKTIKLPADEKEYSIINQADKPLPVVHRLQFSDGQYVDALRKIVISKDSLNESIAEKKRKTYKLRRCTRCRSVSLESDPFVFDSPNTIGLWTMVFQRTCICGNSWLNAEI